MESFSRAPAIAACLAIMLACGCSVKENRSACPCRLEMLFGGELSNPEMVVNISGEGTAEGRMELLHLSEDERRHTLLVPRGNVTLSAYCGSLLIPYGSQCDSVYVHRSEVDCSGESAQVEVLPLKQFASIFLRVISEGYKLSPGDEVRVVGSVSGMDPASGEPLRGDFCYITSLDEDLSCVFRVPRQQDSSLSLVLGSGEENYPFAVGLQILEAGYDWKEDALRDILLDIDLVDMGVKVDVADWTVVPIGQEHPPRLQSQSR